MSILNSEEVARKLRELHGNMAAVARSCGVARQSVHHFVHQHPELVAVFKECREAMKDHAESALYSAIFDKEAWAVCFFLKTQARDRGYVERHEHEHGGIGGGPIQYTDLTEAELDERLRQLETREIEMQRGEAPAMGAAQPE